MLILSIAVFVATLATPVVVLALWQHFEVREARPAGPRYSMVKFR
jgi:hypothetical protein